MSASPIDWGEGSAPAPYTTKVRVERFGKVGAENAIEIHLLGDIISRYVHWNQNSKRGDGSWVNSRPCLGPRPCVYCNDTINWSKYIEAYAPALTLRNNRKPKKGEPVRMWVPIVAVFTEKVWGELNHEFQPTTEGTLTNCRGFRLRVSRSKRGFISIQHAEICSGQDRPNPVDPGVGSFDVRPHLTRMWFPHVAIEMPNDVPNPIPEKPMRRTVSTIVGRVGDHEAEILRNADENRWRHTQVKRNIFDGLPDDQPRDDRAHKHPADDIELGALVKARAEGGLPYQQGQTTQINTPANRINANSGHDRPSDGNLAGQGREKAASETPGAKSGGQEPPRDPDEPGEALGSGMPRQPKPPSGPEQAAAVAGGEAEREQLRRQQEFGRQGEAARQEAEQQRQDAIKRKRSRGKAEGTGLDTVDGAVDKLLNDGVGKIVCDELQEQLRDGHPAKKASKKPGQKPAKGGGK